MKRKTNRVIAFMTTLLFTGSLSALGGEWTAFGGEWEDEFPITQDPVLQSRSYATVSPSLPVPS